MKGKIPTLLSILAITAATSLAPLPTQAEIIKEGKTYWSFREMLDFESEFDAVASVHCGEDYRCRDDFLFESLESLSEGDVNRVKYMNLDYIKNSRFLVTSINPTLGKLSVYYRDEDAMLRRMGIDERGTLNELYLAWVDPEEAGLSETEWLEHGAPLRQAVIDMQDGLAPRAGSHEVFRGDVTTLGEGWLTPHTEVTLDMLPGNEITRDERHMMEQLMVSSNGNMIGAFEYNTCFNGDYREGMECRLMYDSDGQRVYLPFEPESEAEPTDGGSMPTDESTSVDEPISTNESTSADDPTSTNEATSAGAQPALVPSAEVAYSDDMDSPREVAETVISTSAYGVLNEHSTAPENQSAPTPTGTDATKSASLSDDGYIEVPTAANSADSTSFPWWLIALLATGGILIVWWILPSRKSKN